MIFRLRFLLQQVMSKAQLVVKRSRRAARAETSASIGGFVVVEGPGLELGNGRSECEWFRLARPALLFIFFLRIVEKMKKFTLQKLLL